MNTGDICKCIGSFLLSATCCAFMGAVSNKQNTYAGAYGNNPSNKDMSYCLSFVVGTPVTALSIYGLFSNNSIHEEHNNKLMSSIGLGIISGWLIHFYGQPKIIPEIKDIMPEKETRDKIIRELPKYISAASLATIAYYMAQTSGKK